MKHRQTVYLPLISTLFLTVVMTVVLAGTAKGGTLTLGVIEPLSGSVAAQGQAVLNGTLLAVDEINAKGGINGQKVEIVAEDDKATPAEAVAAAHKLITRNRVPLIMGAFNSSCTLAAQEVARREKIILLTPVSTAKSITEQGNPYMFRYALTSYEYMDQTVRFMLEKTKMRRFAFLVENTDQGLSGLEGFKLALDRHGKSLGATLVATEYYNIGDTDFSSQLNKLKAINPPVDAVQTVALITEAALILKQARAQNFKTVFSFMGGPTHPDFIKLAGEASEGIFYSSAFDINIKKPVVQHFVKAFQTKFNKEPEMFAAAGYDSMYVVADAIKRAGGTDVEKLRAALLQTRYDAVQGMTTFNEKGQATIDSLVMTIKGGKRIIVYPTAYAAQ